LSIVKKFLHALFDKIQHIGTHHWHFIYN
jgi:hypothetical protein